MRECRCMRLWVCVGLSACISPMEFNIHTHTYIVNRISHNKAAYEIYNNIYIYISS